MSEVECSIPPDFSVKWNFCSLEVDVMGGKQDKWKHSDFDKQAMAISDSGNLHR